MTELVLVVGAGPAGASTAWHLARLGLAVKLLDRAHFPRDKICAECISPQATRILEDMGALEAIDAAGAAHIPGMKVVAPDGSEFTGCFADVSGFTPFRTTGIGVRRLVLDAILVDCARQAGVEVIEDAHVTDILHDLHGRVIGVQAQDRAGAFHDMPATLVVGADGLRSRVAHRIGVAHQLRTPRRIAIVAHYRGVRGITSVGEMHVERDGYVGLADVGDGITNVAVVVPASSARAVSANKSAFLDAWLQVRPELAMRFADAEQITPTLVTGPFGSRVQTAWAPGVALVGDAADFLDPFTGEGIYAALRGGELIAPFVIDELAHNDSHALEAYDRARHAEFGGKWIVEQIIAFVTSMPALMNHVVHSLEKQHDMANTLMGVTGDFVPAREVLRPGYIARLVGSGF